MVTLGGVPIEGDPALIKSILATHNATRERVIEKGRLIANTRLETIDLVTRASKTVCEAHIEILWLGDNSSRKSSEDQQLGTIPWESEVILTPKRQICFSPLSDLVQVTEKPRFGLSEATCVHPDELWFLFDRRVPFRSMFDPAYKEEHLAKYAIRKDGNDVLIERHYRSGSRYKFVISGIHGQVTSYETEGGQQNYRGQFHWTEMPGQGLHLNSCRCEGSHVKSGKGRVFTMRATDYEAAPKVSPNRFTMEALQIPLGTKVEERDSSGAIWREYRIGG